MTATPKVAAIHDISGFGRCSLTVALPILSVMGVQCAVLPTAYLSTHTAFPDFTFLDLTEEMKKTRLFRRRVFSIVLGFAEPLRHLPLYGQRHLPIPPVL